MSITAQWTNFRSSQLWKFGLLCGSTDDIIGSCKLDMYIILKYAICLAKPGYVLLSRREG